MATSPSRQLTYNYLASLNLWLLLFPCDLCCDWTMGTVPLVESFTDVRNIATILAYTFVATLVWIAFVIENRQQSAIIIMVCIFFLFYNGWVNNGIIWELNKCPQMNANIYIIIIRTLKSVPQNRNTKPASYRIYLKPTFSFYWKIL